MFKRVIQRAFHTRRGVVAGLLASLVLAAACAQPAPSGGRQGPPTVANPSIPQASTLDPNNIRVALLLPMEGDTAQVATAMRNAAEMAVQDVNVPGFQLMPYSTRGTAQGARDAAAEAVRAGANLIIGPLFSASVPGAADAARQAGINVITFSSDRTVAASNVNVMGFLPAEEVRRIMSYAAGNGIGRIALVAPNTPYGREIDRAMTQMAGQAGITFDARLFYDASASDISEPVRNFVAEAPQVGAVLIAEENASRVTAVAQVVRFFGLRSERLLGTGTWANVAADVPALHGAWFAAPDPNIRRDFERRYRSLYGSEPPLPATLAYDAVALAATLGRQPGGFSAQSLRNPSGFSGVTGLFRFGQDGLVQRSLAVLEVDPEDGVIVRAPAEQIFVSETIF